jgi:DNA-binding MarR family transcriptional regulator/predicted GNAT family N-acyltransferase
MKLYEQLGRIALGTRVRFLGDKISEDSAQIYQLYGIKMHPKWFPVFYVLSQIPESSITAIAEDIGHSHASVSKIASEMLDADLIEEKPSPLDRRRTLLQLTSSGRRIAQQIKEQYRDVKAAVEELSAQSHHDLWKALEEWEYLLNQQSLLQRVKQMKKQRQAAQIKIVPYQSKYRLAFQKLNEEWIINYFKMEEADHQALDNPEDYILRRGGFILVALLGEQVVGVCALLKRNDKLYPYELAKMAVAKEARGKGAGWLLGQAVIKKAKTLKASKLFLESNTRLKPAIGLYEKLGFKKVIGPTTPYERCNIQMELEL